MKIYKTEKGAQIAATKANKKAKNLEYWVVDFKLANNKISWIIRDESVEPRYYKEPKG